MSLLQACEYDIPPRDHIKECVKYVFVKNERYVKDTASPRWQSIQKTCSADSVCIVMVKGEPYTQQLFNFSYQILNERKLIAQS